MPDEGEEKTLPATPRRREEARKNGQVARSQELGAAATLLALVLILHALLPGAAGRSLLEDFQASFRFDSRDMAFGFGDLQRRTLTAAQEIARIVIPAMASAALLAMIVAVAQVGFQVNPQALAPKWERVNPASGLKRLFSLRGVVELVKGVFKLSLVGWLCYSVVRGAVDSGELLRTIRMPLPSALAVAGSLLWTIGLRAAVTLFLMAIADYAYQKYEFEKSLKMSLTEVKQEMKQTEGDPHIKARIRRLQREMAKKRMMQDVPKADVVVTNPTHYAVALQYEAGSMAPKVVAKGQDEIARVIREIAEEHGVPLVENKPLAQTLYKTVQIGQEIPGDLYEAVAQVLAFVYRTYRRRPPV